MTKCARFSSMCIAVAALLAIHCHSERPAEPGYAPPGFDVQLLEILACPENLTGVRLATRTELNAIDARIRAGTLRQWDGTPRHAPVAAALIREDNRIAYEIREGVPIMLIERALVLDETVGRPDPDKHRSTGA